MLNKVLGRAGLKARIEELEEERDSLQARLDAESERRSEAVSARQEAQEEVNRLEDRIADLEGRLDRADDGERDLGYRGTERLRGDRLGDVLGRLRSVEAPPEGALTATVDGEGDLPAAVVDAFGDRAGLLRRAAPCLAFADDAGLVSVALDPPLPPSTVTEWGPAFRLDEAWFRPTGPYALALVRSDTFAYGEFEGDERVAFEGVESDVMGAHSKGGFSQARFERRRDEQVDRHLDRCREVIADHDPETLYVVGERTVLDRFEDLADATRFVDARGDPEEALRSAVREFWTTELYLV
jgi:hypothetical protein